MNVLIEVFQILIPELFLLNDLFAAKRDLTYYDGFMLFFASCGLGIGMFSFPFVIVSTLTKDVALGIGVAAAFGIVSIAYRNLVCRRFASMRQLNMAVAAFCCASSYWAWQSGALPFDVAQKYGAFLVFYIAIFAWTFWRARIFNKTRWFWLSEAHAVPRPARRR